MSDFNHWESDEDKHNGEFDKRVDKFVRETPPKSKLLLATLSLKLIRRY